MDDGPYTPPEDTGNGGRTVRPAYPTVPGTMLPRQIPGFQGRLHRQIVNSARRERAHQIINQNEGDQDE